jgi:hypothetical protein
MLAVMRLRPGETVAKIKNTWTAVSVGEAAPPNTEIARGELALGRADHAFLRYTLPQDLPLGTYRLAVTADDKPWASLEIPVVAAKEAAPLAKPSDLLPLEPGRAWTYAWSFSAGPAVKNLTVAGAEKGADGTFRATMVFSVAGVDEHGTRVELRRNGTLVSEEWWTLSEAGVAVSRMRAEGKTHVNDPPLPTIALPLRSPAKWKHEPKAGSPPIEYRMWGPHPVQTPSGEVPGWIVWMKTAGGGQVSTIERHFAPGVGVVREVHVDAAGPTFLTRLETKLLSTK